MEPTIRKIYFRIFTLENEIAVINGNKRHPLHAETADVEIARRDVNIQCKTEEILCLNEIISNLVKH